jgi:hypothetical protein
LGIYVQVRGHKVDQRVVEHWPTKGGANALRELGAASTVKP